MASILVIGAGLSGCAAAHRLACGGIEVFLVERASDIGGRVRSYGCKAVDKCQDCGVCLAGGLWDKVSRHPSINIITDATIKDVTGRPGSFTATVKGAYSEWDIAGLEAVVVCTGFEGRASGHPSHLHIAGTEGLITGTQLEGMLRGRTRTGFLENTPGSVAFIQCLGSRDQKEGGLYCSRVCCAYTTRSAKVIRSYYPECEIVFFYMELQSVETGDYFAELKGLGMEFVKCRPLKISGGKPVVVEYDVPGVGIARRGFDLAVLADGIHAQEGNDLLAEVLGLGQDGHGFLRVAGEDSGVYVSGCARAPMKIAEAYADSVAVAGAVIMQNSEFGIRN